jgi:tetratricopeptide (TPR) repeat protein
MAAQIIPTHLQRDQPQSPFPSWHRKCFGKGYDSTSTAEYTMRSICYIFFISCAPLIALAQPQAPPEGWVEKAQTHLNLLEYQEALDAYKEAYKLSRDPELLFHIGQCYDQLKQPERALNSYETYLTLAPDGPLRAAVESLVSQRRAALQGSSLGTSIKETPNSNASLLIDNPTPKSDEVHPSAWLYGGFISGVSLGLGAGAVALSARLDATRAAIDGSSEDFINQSKLSRRMGLASDFLFIGGIASGAAAYMIKPSVHTNKILFGLSGLTGASAISLGTVALLADKGARAGGDPNKARYRAESAVLYSQTADTLFIATAVSGGLGLWLSLKREPNVRLSPASRGVALQFDF